MEKRNKKSIVGYFIKMTILFFVFLIVQQLLSAIILSSLKEERYGNEALFEVIWAGLVLILLMLYKNRYIFTQKRESFTKGFKYIIPEFIIATFFLILSIITLSTSSMPINIFSIINLLIYCIFIGIVEEFLCRGWLLNEFLERFSNNKKEIILSIIFSSFVFGIIHFLNIGTGQNFIETCVQVVNAGVSGIFLALVYYKTKNIWLVVFSHFYWDFSIMLMEHNQLVDCYNGNSASTHAVLASVLSGVIIIIGYLIMSYWLYRKTDLYEKKNNKSMNYLVPLGVIVYIFGIFVSSLFLGDDDERICPVYENKTVGSDYVLIMNNYKKFEMAGSSNKVQYNYELYSDKDYEKVLLHDNIENKTFILSDIYYDYLLVENKDTYSIIIQNGNDKVLYGTFAKSDIENFDSYSKYIKENLKEYYTPEINEIYIMNEKGNDYNYVVLDTTINKKMIFDKDDKLFFIDFE